MSACFLIAIVLASTSNSELLHFTAPWCQACQESEPAVKRLEASGFPVRHLNVDERPDVARRFNVKTVPSFILVSNGKVVNRIDRGVSYQELVQLVQPRTARGSNTRASQSYADSYDAPRPTRQPSQGPASSTEGAAMASTVRFKVEDSTGFSFGTGTIIDVHDGEALILTCGHIFNESRGKGLIHIDSFNARRGPAVIGRLLRYDMKNDLALVVCKPPMSVQAAPVAGTNSEIRNGVPVFSVGCNKGEDPTVMRGNVNAIDRYLGPPSNVIVSGTPIDGRSGGGLFNGRGELIGVCQNADPERNEGIYGFLPSVHQYLDRANLGFVYQRSNDSSARLQEPALLTRNAPLPLIERRDSRIEPAELQTRGQPEPLLRSVGLDREQMEVVCIVRSKDDPSSKSRVIVIDQPTTAFMDRLRMEQSNESHQITELRVSKRKTRESTR